MDREADEAALRRGFAVGLVGGVHLGGTTTGGCWRPVRPLHKPRGPNRASSPQPSPPEEERERGRWPTGSWVQSPGLARGVLSPRLDELSGFGFSWPCSELAEAKPRRFISGQHGGRDTRAKRRG